METSSARSPFYEVSLLSVWADLAQFLSGSRTVPEKKAIAAGTNDISFLTHVLAHSFHLPLRCFRFLTFCSVKKSKF
jgi:hypothetical protein